MSSDAYGVPQRKYDFGRDIGLGGQGLIVGGQYKMQDYLCWARSDVLTCVAGVNAYLPFDVPPLPVGSTIHVHAMATTVTASEALGVGMAYDWLVVPPVLVATMGSTAYSAAGPVDHWITIRDRTTAVWSSRFPSSTGNGTATIDWQRSNRLAVYGNEASALVIAFAFVEVFIARAYR